MDAAPAGPAVLVNLDADPALEVVAVSANGTVYALNGDGTNFGPAWPKALGGPVDAALAVGNLDADGALEIVVRKSPSLYVFNADGSTVSGWPVTTTLPSGGVSPVVGDIDADGSFEIIEGEQQGGSKSIVAYRANGTVLMRHDFTGAPISALALGDIDNDGMLEIFMTDTGGRVSAFDRLGNMLSGWPVLSQAVSAIKGSAIIADVDGDGNKDVLAGNLNGRVYGWNRFGTLILLTSSTVLTSGTPAVGDVDGDGDIEIITANDTNGAISIFDLPGTYNESTLAWPMFRGDPQRTGHHRLRQIITLLEGPNSDAGPNQGSPTPSGFDHYFNVDDDPHDGDSTILSFSSGGYKEVYTHDDWLLDSDHVTNVKVRWVAKKGSGSPWQAAAGLVVGGTEYYGPTINLPVNYTLREESFPNNPQTTQPWTVQEVRDANLIYQQVSIVTQLPRARLTEIVLIVTVERPY
jgi:hypothetical protein